MLIITLKIFLQNLQNLQDLHVCYLIFLQNLQNLQNLHVCYL
jgi:hypothetical protein